MKEAEETIFNKFKDMDFFKKLETSRKIWLKKERARRKLVNLKKRMKSKRKRIKYYKQTKTSYKQ
jgi:hypothetical protein